MARNFRELEDKVGDDPSPDDAADCLPLAIPLKNAPAPEVAFQRLAQLPGALFLDSAQRHPTLGRYSFLAADPFESLTCSTNAGDPLAQLAERMNAFRSETLPGLPPFQGGAAGMFGYELGGSLEKVPRATFDEFCVPVLAIGFYDVVIAWDHATGEAWIISHGWPEQENSAKQQRAAARGEQFRQWLFGESTPPKKAPPHDHRKDIPASELAPQFAAKQSGHSQLTSNFSRADFERTVARVIEYIRAGDVFQVNLAQRLLHPATCDSVSLYLRLRQCNPATFAGYFDLGEFQIVSASPERFIQSIDGEVETRPIKGTRRRSPSHPAVDLLTGDELLESQKDRAENIMIVDLLRNDLSRVCLPDSVQVKQLCALEKYETVQHLVSVVAGRLAEGRTALDLLRAAFPGGSITGAPKVRAMEIIAELEPTARAPYCGSLGYLGFDGNLDLSILIRTITAGRGWWQLPVGGGIVAQSDPMREYEETWHKAAGLLRAI